MSCQLEQVNIVQHRRAFNGHAEGATTSSGLINFRHLQFHTVSAVGYADFVAEIAVAFGLEYGAAVGNSVRGGIRHAADEIPVSLVVNAVVRCTALRSTYVYGNDNVRRIGWDVAAGAVSDQTHFSVLGAPAIAIRVSADITADSVAIFGAAVSRAGFHQGQHFLCVALTHDADGSGVPVQAVANIPEGLAIFGASGNHMGVFNNAGQAVDLGVVAHAAAGVGQLAGDKGAVRR